MRVLKNMFFFVKLQTADVEAVHLLATEGSGCGQGSRTNTLAEKNTLSAWQKAEICKLLVSVRKNEHSSYLCLFLPVPLDWISKERRIIEPLLSSQTKSASPEL